MRFTVRVSTRFTIRVSILKLTTRVPSNVQRHIRVLGFMIVVL